MWFDQKVTNADLEGKKLKSTLVVSRFVHWEKMRTLVRKLRDTCPAGANKQGVAGRRL